MEKLKFFSSQKMSWLKVIIFSISTAVLTAVLNLIPFLNNTSFQDIAISYECWILFAIYIIVNCQKWYEAALKTFVFFLISQPLIYLIEVPFDDMGFQLFTYYKFWFILTLLTLPGAAIAFLLKRKDWLSVAVLSVATCFLGFLAVNYFWMLTVKFPYHLISMCFCVGLAVFLILALLDKKAHQIVAIILVLIAIIVSLIFLKPNRSFILVLEEGKWTYSVDNTENITVEVKDDNQFLVTGNHEGSSHLTFKNDKGETKKYEVTILKDGIALNEIE